MQTDAIWIIDSDDDDPMMVREVWQELKLKNELVFLDTAESALEHLSKTTIAPFIIICEFTYS